MKYFFSTLTLLALILSGCQSQKAAMEALSGQTFYAYSLHNGKYRESSFPLLPKDVWDHPYKYLHFQLQPKGNYLYVTYDKVENGQLTTHTKRYWGLWRKQGFRYQSRWLISPLVPLFFGWDMQRYYFKVDDKQNIDFTEKGSQWFFIGGFGYAYDPYYGGGRFKTVAHTERPMVYFDQGRYGIRTNKDTLTAPLYDELSWFENRVARARKEHYWGVIDTLGREVIPSIYEQISYESSSKTPVFLVQKDSLKGIFSLKGEQLTPIQYKHLEYYWLGVLLAQKDNLWGFIGSDGKEKLAIIYDRIKRNDYGYTLIKGDKVGFFRYGGQYARYIPAVYTEIDFPSTTKEFAVVHSGEKLLLIDRKGVVHEAVPTKVKGIDVFLDKLEGVAEYKGQYYKPAPMTND
nr:WG repeat-containing protein [uncultured Capnocytophaga sp.]